jgi:hypothetical protein
MKRRTFLSVRDLLKVGIHGVFVAGQRFGVDILPPHFYSSIPSVRELRSSDSWRTPMTMVGVNGVAIESQVEFLQSWCGPYRDRLQRGGIHEYACRENGF